MLDPIRRGLGRRMFLIGPRHPWNGDLDTGPAFDMHDMVRSFMKAGPSVPEVAGPACLRE